MKIASKSTAVSFLKSLTARRLIAGDIVFSQYSFEDENTIAFRMEPVFNVEEVFGLMTIPNERVGITARYDTVRRHALCTLDLLVKLDASEHRYEYMLTREERRMLGEKMDSFFQQRTGIPLDGFSMEHLTMSAATG